MSRRCSVLLLFALGSKSGWSLQPTAAGLAAGDLRIKSQRRQSGPGQGVDATLASVEVLATGDVHSKHIGVHLDGAVNRTKSFPVAVGMLVRDHLKGNVLITRAESRLDKEGELRDPTTTIQSTLAKVDQTSLRWPWIFLGICVSLITIAMCVLVLFPGHVAQIKSYISRPRTRPSCQTGPPITSSRDISSFFANVDGEDYDNPHDVGQSQGTDDASVSRSGSAANAGTSQSASIGQEAFSIKLNQKAAISQIATMRTATGTPTATETSDSDDAAWGEKAIVFSLTTIEGDSSACSDRVICVT